MVAVVVLLGVGTERIPAAVVGNQDMDLVEVGPVEDSSILAVEEVLGEVLGEVGIAVRRIAGWEESTAPEEDLLAEDMAVGGVDTRCFGRVDRDSRTFV